MQALLSDGPLEGRTIGVDTHEDLPPRKIEVDVEDGSVHAYVFDRVDHDQSVAVYTHADSYQH